MLTSLMSDSVWLQPKEQLDGISLIDHLFNRLNGMYPGKFTANFKDMDALSSWKVAWADAFDAERVTPKDVSIGLQNCLRMFDWPPSLPEFLRACRPHLEADVAFFEAVREMRKRSQGEDGQFSHPAIYHAAVMIGQHDLMNCSYQTLSNRWKAALSSQLSLGQWADIPAVVPALPAPARTEESKQQARQVMTTVKGAFQSNGRNKKSWAQDILDNPKGRPLAIITMAQKALGVTGTMSA